MKLREEKDFLGNLNVPQNAYWGIHTMRAIENFDICDYKVDEEFIKAYGIVKLACAKTITDLNIWDKTKSNAILQASLEVSEGKYNNEIVVNPLQGGAGTSLNMNINEVIANRALEILGYEKGQYNIIHPINDINLYQSTNDTFPTALKIACINLLRKLEQNVTALQDCLQEKEKEFADVVKIARTQLMDAVLTTLGREFSAYAECISRDRWRIYKCEERLRVVNIGGTAIGTGIGAPRKYIFGVIENLKELSGLSLARAENMVDNTQNVDVFSEVSGILKAHATNLIKISNDLRIMSSGPDAGFGEITLPPVQAGSSIMPAKINPVIPEMAAQSGIKVLGNDVIINYCVSQGQFELNQFMPLLAFTMLETLKILINTNKILQERCIKNIKANKDNINKKINNSQALLTALLPKFGYEKIVEIAQKIPQGINVKDYLLNNGYITEIEFIQLTSPEAVLTLGCKNL
ncbi:MAG: aspartate ammonia-lyase [Candidatus Gastranaerophilaceae bacterium]